jgi:hypothetical protein
MITMKAATIAAAAVGAVGAISGVTWAAAGQPNVGLTGAHDKVPAAVHQVKGAVPPPPTSVPSCVPTDKLPQPPTHKLPKLPTDKLPKVPTDKLPKDRLPKPPTDKVPTDKLPKVPTDKLPNPTQPGNPGTPGTPAPMPRPTCLPDASRLPKPPADKLPGDPTQKLPKPGVPAVPALPKNVDCGKLPAPVQVGGAVEKALILSKGLHFAGVEGATKQLKARHICAITQKWTGTADRYLTIERLKAPAGTTERQLRQALALPATGQLPGGGVLTFDPNGYWLLANASSLFASDLPELASAVQQAR